MAAKNHPKIYCTVGKHDGPPRKNLTLPKGWRRLNAIQTKNGEFVYSANSKWEIICCPNCKLPGEPK